MTCFVCAGGKTPPRLKSHTVIRERAKEGRTDCSNGVKRSWPEAMAVLLIRPNQKRTSVTQGPAWTSTLLLRKLLPAEWGLAEAPWRQLFQRDLVFVYGVPFVSGSEKYIITNGISKK